MASEMLKNNTTNRKIRITHVNRLKSEILAGRWLITHQGIAFADDGSLIDGQHRLLAIEAAGKPVQIMVTKDVPKFHNGDINLNTMDVIDCGKPRSTADQLNLLHGVHNANRVVGALRMIAWAFTNSFGAKALTVGQASDMLEIYGDGIALLHDAAQVSKLCQKTAVVAALAIGYKIAPDPAILFMKRLNNGSGISDGDPVYALRESLIAYPPSSNETERVNLMLRTSAALYNTIKEVPIKTAKVSKIGLDYFMNQDKKNVEKVKKIITGQ